MQRLATPDEVILFWREAGPDKWFSKDETFDQVCRELGVPLLTVVQGLVGGPGPAVAGLEDAVCSAAVLDAIEHSAREQQWVPVSTTSRST